MNQFVFGLLNAYYHYNFLLHWIKVQNKIMKKVKRRWFILLFLVVKVNFPEVNWSTIVFKTIPFRIRFSGEIQSLFVLLFKLISFAKIILKKNWKKTTTKKEKTSLQKHTNKQTNKQIASLDKTRLICKLKRSSPSIKTQYTLQLFMAYYERKKTYRLGLYSQCKEYKPFIWDRTLNVNGKS
jgi:hypothetical protein